MYVPSGEEFLCDFFIALSLATRTVPGQSGCLRAICGINTQGTGIFVGLPCSKHTAEPFLCVIPFKLHSNTARYILLIWYWKWVHGGTERLKNWPKATNQGVAEPEFRYPFRAPQPMPGITAVCYRSTVCRLAFKNSPNYLLMAVVMALEFFTCVHSDL